MRYLKRKNAAAEQSASDVSDVVQGLLDQMETGGEQVARDLCRQFDGWAGDVLVSEAQLAQAAEKLTAQERADIEFAHDNVRRFAQAQRATIQDTQIEILPGFVAGQRQIPVQSAGCYVPGGRYAHIASAIMTITTAKVAGVGYICACSPPSGPDGIPAEILYAMQVCGADQVLNMGGVQAVASMAHGFFGLPKVDVLAGPGNQYVADAKRILFGQVGIDMVAGPTDLLVLADGQADPFVVAWDLVGQAEHGANSPVWLVTDDVGLAEQVLKQVPDMIASLPEPNRSSAQTAWDDLAEIVICEDRDEMVQVSDRYAPEHLQVQCADQDWWLSNLNAYGSLFLGEETTVAFGDKAAGPNHVLPTSGAARYTGGLSVAKFMKTVTWQASSRDAMRPIAEATARISRMEGMEGHARTADIRLAKYFPDEVFSLGTNKVR
ncbi:histidinol dehydrogenase [Aestuariibius sp. HNIBRBA575]|uniref:histidinol dehydrogenase n=1 Tax=Aestuariibius sp. HNIBRBA575 TaxID=3233343 RepID=UPI0034A2E49E